MYNLDFFINKFENIDDSTCITKKICTGGNGEPLKFDCLGHCQDSKGKFDFNQRRALISLGNVVQAWDGNLNNFSQPTPRLRLLAYLYSLKSF
jgi:hypothetical protein